MRRVAVAVGLTIFVLISLIINGLQARQIVRLEDEIQRVNTRGDLPVGTHVQPLRSRDATGHEVLIDFGAVSKPTILYIFRPGCGWCERNAVAFNNLAAALSSTYN